MPAIYKDYTVEQLNNQFNNRLHVPEYADYFSRWDSLSQETRSTFKNFRDLVVGEHPQECLDIFPSDRQNSKVVVFIHGGYWHLLDKAMFHFLANPFLCRQVTMVFINYKLAPASDIDQIVASGEKAINWVYSNIKNFNGDPEEIYLLGHSAGAQLAAMMMTKPEFNFLKAVTALSGLYRLEPIIHTFINEVLHLTQASAARNSPVLFTPVVECPVLLAVGSDETSEFRDQNAEINTLWNNKIPSVKLISVPGANHYSILDEVTNSGSLLQDEMFHLMQLH